MDWNHVFTSANALFLIVRIRQGPAARDGLARALRFDKLPDLGAQLSNAASVTSRPLAR